MSSPVAELSLDSTPQECSPAAPAPSQLEQILRARLPNWGHLAEEAQLAGKKPPLCVVGWGLRANLPSPFWLRTADTRDVRLIDSGLSLQLHPGILQLLLGWLFSPLLFLFGLVDGLRAAIQAQFARLAAALGPVFALLALPLAVLLFASEAMAFVVGLVARLPWLVFSPLRLIATVVLLPFRLLLMFVSTLLRTLALSAIGRLLDAERFAAALLAHPWIRPVALGFFRGTPPDEPVLIDRSSVSEIRTVERLGFTGRRAFLVLVEGDPLGSGPGFLVQRLARWVLPFFWLRTVHMLRLPGGPSGNAAATAIARHIGLPVLHWGAPPTSPSEAIPGRRALALDVSRGAPAA